MSAQFVTHLIPASPLWFLFCSCPLLSVYCLIGGQADQDPDQHRSSFDAQTCRRSYPTLSGRSGVLCSGITIAAAWPWRRQACHWPILRPAPARSYPVIRPCCTLGDRRLCPDGGCKGRDGSSFLPASWLHRSARLAAHPVLATGNRPTFSKLAVLSLLNRK